MISGNVWEIGVYEKYTLSIVYMDNECIHDTDKKLREQGYILQSPQRYTSYGQLEADSPQLFATQEGWAATRELEDKLRKIPKLKLYDGRTQEFTDEQGRIIFCHAPHDVAKSEIYRIRSGPVFKGQENLTRNGA